MSSVFSVAKEDVAFVSTAHGTRKHLAAEATENTAWVAIPVVFRSCFFVFFVAKKFCRCLQRQG